MHNGCVTRSRWAPSVGFRGRARTRRRIRPLAADDSARVPTTRTSFATRPPVDDFNDNIPDDGSPEQPSDGSSDAQPDRSADSPSAARRNASEKLAQRAAEHFRRGRLKEAEADLRRALSANPARGDWHFNLGLTLEAAGRFDDALRSFRDAVLRLPRRAEARFAEGAILCRLGRHLESIQPLETATTLDKRCDPAWAKLIDAHAELGQYEDAETVYYVAQENLDRMPLTLVAMGELQLRRDRSDRAAWCFREAMGQAPELPRIRSRLARALLMGGQPDAAIRMYLEELRVHPGDVTTLLECGDLLTSQHRIGEAVEKYRRAAELAPNMAAPRARLGMVLVAIGRGEQARTELETAYALDPNTQLVRVTLAGVLATEGSSDSALRLLREELARRRDFGSEVAAAELLRACECLVTCGAADEAADALERVHAERPEDMAVARRLMVLSFACGRRRRARGLARAIARHDPAAAAARDYNLLLDAIELGRYRLARGRLRAAARAHPNDPSFRSLRLRVLGMVPAALLRLLRG